MWQIPVDTHTKKTLFFAGGKCALMEGTLLNLIQSNLNIMLLQFRLHFFTFFKIAFKNKEIVIMTVFQNSSIVLLPRLQKKKSRSIFDDELKIGDV